MLPTNSSPGLTNMLMTLTTPKRTTGATVKLRLMEHQWNMISLITPLLTSWVTLSSLSLPSAELSSVSISWNGMTIFSATSMLLIQPPWMRSEIFSWISTLLSNATLFYHRYKKRWTSMEMAKFQDAILQFSWNNSETQMSTLRNTASDQPGTPRPSATTASTHSTTDYQ